MKNNYFNPKVSIIIPVYNGSNYVKEAIESALAQTYNNLEIIVVNDGSTDEGKTDAICKSYGKRIRYFAKKNGGVATALNLAIDMMKGEYFSWLSHDDVYYPEKIEKSVEYISKLKNREVVLFCDYETINEESQLIEKIRFNHNVLKQKPEYGLLRGCINGITMLIPRKAFTQCGNFDLKLRCTQDYDMWRRIMKKFEFVHAPLIFTQTRIHAGQDSNKHPNVLTEGNPLWISMMNNISKERMKSLEGTEYNFQKEMVKFLNGTPYSEASLYAKNKMVQILNANKKKILDTKVSVVVPMGESKESITTIIRAMKKQTHSNWELLIAKNDDLSTNSDNRIKFLEKTSEKPISQNISGEYVIFPAGESISRPNLIELLLTEILLTGRNLIIAEEGDFSSICMSILSKRQQTMILKREFLVKNDISIMQYQNLEFLNHWMMRLSVETPFFQLSQIYSSSKSLEAEREKVRMIEEIYASMKRLRQGSIENKQLLDECKKIMRLCDKLVASENDKNNNGYWRNKPSNPVLKLIYLFKQQGILLTIRKILAKYNIRNFFERRKVR